MSSSRLKIGVILAVAFAFSPAPLYAQKTPVEVRVVLPRKGDLERLSVQPGTLQAFETVRLYTRAAGFLKTQNVDIGDRVKRGQVLAVIDVPELEGQVKLDQVGVRQAEARLLRSKAGVKTVMAEVDALKAALQQAVANVQSAEAAVRAREAQFKRVKDLFDKKAADERLLDESRDQFVAARAAVESAKAAILSAEAHVAAGASRVDQAKADVAVMEAGVEAARVKLEISNIRVAFATIIAPFDGVITQRDFFPGDLIRSPDQQGAKPLLTIQRVDKFRVVVAVPERDVPFTDRGDVASVEIDAYPGKKWAAKVSRIARFEDPKARTMRVELDLPNPDGRLFSGMAATVSIALDAKKDAMSIPSTCVLDEKLVGKVLHSVCVVRDGRAQRVRVELGVRAGQRVEILKGLAFTDQVIVQPAGLSDGAAVTLSASKEKD